MLAQQGKSCAPVMLPLDQFQFVHQAFCWSLAVGHGERRYRRLPVGLQSSGKTYKFRHPAAVTRLYPIAQSRLSRTIPHELAESVDQIADDGQRGMRLTQCGDKCLLLSAQLSRSFHQEPLGLR